MTTIRIAKRQRFTTVDRRPVNDARLSFRARGLLFWMLDKPDDATFSAEEIAAEAREGRDAIRTALRELEEAGYLRRRRWRTPAGTWATEHTLHEVSESDQSGKPAPVNQRRLTSAGFPGPVLPEDSTKTEEPPNPPPSGGRRSAGTNPRAQGTSPRQVTATAELDDIRRRRELDRQRTNEVLAADRRAAAEAVDPSSSPAAQAVIARCRGGPRAAPPGLPTDSTESPDSILETA
jgi:hypothetical protein